MKKHSETRQTLLAAGNWLWSLFTINLAWFGINFPVILTLILMFSMPNGRVMIPGAVVLVLMLSLFTLPSLVAVFRAVDQWQVNGDGNYARVVLKGWRQALPDFLVNLTLATALMIIVLLLKASVGDILVRSGLLVWFGALLLVVVARSYLVGLARHDVTLGGFIIANGGKLVLATGVFILLMGINVFLKLAFVILVASVSLAAFISYQLLNGAPVKNEVREK